MKQGERNHDAFEAALLEERPEISREFAAELDAWAAEGFPPRKAEDTDGASALAGLRARLSGIRLSGMLAPAAGLAVALVAVVVAVSSIQGGGTDDSDTGGVGGGSATVESETGDTALQEAAPGTSAAPADDMVEPGGSRQSETTIVPAPGEPPILDGGNDRDQLKPGQERIQGRTVSTTLSTDPDEVTEVSDGVIEVTERYDGIVSSSNVNTSDGKGRATFALRIPTQNLQAFLADLSDLASVQARNEGSLDITAPFVTAEERFDEAKAEVDSLVVQLAEADSPEEMAEIKADLSRARGTLASVRSELADLKQRADFATVSVTVTGEGDSDGWSLGDAADDALSVLSDIAGATLIALAAIVPLGLLAAAIFFATSKLRRRRRESALDD